MDNMLSKALNTAIVQKMNDTGQLEEMNSFGTVPLPSEEEFYASAHAQIHGSIRAIADPKKYEALREEIKYSMINIADMGNLKIDESFEVSDELVNEIIMSTIMDGDDE